MTRLKNCKSDLLPKMLVLIAVMSCVTTVTADPVLATWEAQQVRFRYLGINTVYACDGIQSKIKALLLAIGARDDVRIEAKCLVASSDLQRNIKVLLAFAVPVVADSAGLADETFLAEWREVRVTARTSRELDVGDCELVEQLKKKVLPRLGISTSNSKLHCSPSRISFTMKVKALMPIAKEEIISIQD